MWSPGDIVVLRYGHGGNFSGGLPLTVVEDSEEQLVAYLAAGTETFAPQLAETSSRWRSGSTRPADWQTRA